MNTEITNRVLNGIEEDIIEPKTDSHAMLGDILHSIHHLPQPKALREVFEAIDKTDVHYQTNAYATLISVESITAIDQLRHRADMMRRRADEFDEMADKFQSAVDKIIKDTGSVSDTHQAILNLLSEHAHIKPTRT